MTVLTRTAAGPRSAAARKLLAPGGGLADPAVFAEFGVKCTGQWAFVGDGDVGFYVLEFAHAGDDGGDVVVAKDKAKSHLGHGRASRNERLQRVGVFNARAEIFRDEVGAAPILGGPS